MTFRDLARRLKLPLTYEEGPGDHDWACWDRQIRRVLEWLPLKKQGRVTRAESPTHHISRTIVTGPSLTSRTSMWAPKMPLATGTPRAARAWQKAS